MLCRYSTLVLLVIVSASALFGEEAAYRIDQGEKVDAPRDVPMEVRRLLGETPVRLRDAQNRLLAELWLRKEFPVEATAAQVKNGLTYEEVPETTLLGVVRFSNDAQDYRKQRVPAGVYTLRLAHQPQVGDHDGTAPYRTFALASRVADDRQAGTIEIEKMRELSARVTEGHASPWMFFPPGKDVGPSPKLLDKGKGHWVLFWKQDVKVDDQSASLGFGLTLIGVSASR